jgi:hypothetical protein
MSWKTYWFFSAVSLILLTVLAFFQSSPGYMDAEYYYSMGLRIVKEGTLSEPFLWNYLHGLRTIPHPGFTYWQPFSSFVAAGSMAVTGLMNFTGAKVGFLLIYSLVPVICMKLAFTLTSNKQISILTGVLTLTPVFYSPFLATTDSFGIMMVLGGLFFLVINQNDKLLSKLILGVLVGLIHLSRSEGLIWLLMGFGILLVKTESKGLKIGLFLIGYIMVMGPWYLRNWFAMGEILPSGTSQMFWLTEYNDLFISNPADLNLQNWIAQGPGVILGNILSSASANLKTFLFVQGQLILAPFIGLGIWKLRKDPVIRIASILYVILFLLMSVVFPFAGGRGGFFHASAGLQSLIWVLSAVGFDLAVDFGVKNRSWEKGRATIMFGTGLVLILMLVMIYTYSDRVIGGRLSEPAWNQSELVAVSVGDDLTGLGVDEEELVMINNPPGLYAATGRSSIVIPNGNEQDIIDLSREFGVSILVLEKNHPPDLGIIYQDPEKAENLDLIYSSRGIHYFKINSGDL